jgi:hypothetical protein
MDYVKEPLIGTIWATSWGYDQTNVEFFQVIRETEKSVWVREIMSVAKNQRLFPIFNAFIKQDPRQTWWENEHDPKGKRCLKPQADAKYPSIHISGGFRWASRYEGGGKYETFAAGGMGH